MLKGKFTNMKFIITIILFLITATAAMAQKETEIWYFGEYCGLDFSSGAPVALSDGQINTSEGCAVQSDRNGELLFYTDGVSVWNRLHERTPNGTNLDGHSSSTQSAAIVPFPGADSLYFIFTSDDKFNAGGVKYTLFDLSLDGGFGDIVDTAKNVELFAPAAEKLCVVQAADCSGYWVITHEWNSDAFRAYKVGVNGVDTSPVISNVGVVYEGSDHNKKGYLKTNAEGTKLAAASGYTSTYEVFDFNSYTGEISNPTTISLSDFEAYGVEFSPDGSKLYAAANTTLIWWWYENRLFQFDLEAGSQDEIINSRTTIAEQENDEQFGAMQLGPDDKIYVAREGKNSLGAINAPNESGDACDYAQNGADLGGGACVWGLPNFMASYYYNKCLIKFPDTTAKVGSKDFVVELSAELSCPTSGSAKFSYEAKLRFDAHIFYFRKIENCSLHNLSIDGGGWVELEVSDTNRTAGDSAIVLAKIYGDILLGTESDTTPLLITDFKITEGDYEIEKADGVIETFGVCQPDLRKIKTTGTEETTLNPNPVKDICEVKIRDMNRGNYSLTITDERGVAIKTVKWENGEYFEPIKKVRVNFETYSSGLYFITLRTPFKVFVEKVVHIK